MKNNHFIFILLAVLVFAGCKERIESPIIYVNQEMLPYCWFPNGGYWVYQEANTPGWVDSTYIIGNPEIDVIPDNYGDGFQTEKYYITYFFRGKQAGQSIAGKAYGPNLASSFSLMRESFQDSLGERRDVIFFWNSENPDSFPPSPSIQVRQRYDSIVIQGKTYFDAIEIVKDPPQAAEHTYEVIWVRGVGIVRRSMTDGTVWELLRYHINN